MSELLAKLLGFIENRNTRQAIAAIAISTLLIGCSIAIVSINYDGGWHLKIPQQFAIAFIVVYLVIFVASWFILYLLNLKDGQDVYSEVRDNLSGMWVVTYDADIGPVSGQVVVPTRAIGCFISVNAEQKLELTFRVKDDPIFKDDERAVIRDVAVRYNDSGGYTMFYYYSGERCIKEECEKLILPEEGHNRADEVEVEVFGHVQFEKKPKSGRIESMTGHWFDLNGNLSRLFALIDMKVVAQIKQQTFERIRLSQVPIHQKHFDADMGTVSFTRTI